MGHIEAKGYISNKGFGLSYKMWFSNYQADYWKEQIWYRSSTNGINWDSPQLVISAVPLDDWRFPTALHLTNGKYRLYYDYIYRDVYDFIYFYRANVESDGVTASNIVQFAKTTPGPYGILPSVRILGATIIGNQDGDNHHRVWAAGDGSLLKYDSFDEGQSWTETNTGTYNYNNYAIIGTFYGAKAIIPATIDIDSDILNLASKGEFTAFISLPERYNVADINVTTVQCEGAPAVKGMVSEEKSSIYVAKFNREDLLNIGTGDKVLLKVTGKVYHNGNLVEFAGSDTIRVINQKGNNKFKS